MRVNEQALALALMLLSQGEASPETLNCRCSMKPVVRPLVQVPDEFIATNKDFHGITLIDLLHGSRCLHKDASHQATSAASSSMRERLSMCRRHLAKYGYHL